jgi:hypothetical protein
MLIAIDMGKYRESGHNPANRTTSVQCWHGINALHSKHTLKYSTESVTLTVNEENENTINMIDTFRK